MQLNNAHPTILAMIHALKQIEDKSTLYEKELAVLNAAKIQAGQRGVSRCVIDIEKILALHRKAENIKQNLVQDMTKWLKKHEARPDDIGTKKSDPRS